MKIKYLASVSAFLMLSSISSAQKPNVDFILEVMKQNGGFAEGAQCLGIAEDKMDGIMRKAIAHCFGKYEMAQEDALDACFKTQISSLSGKSPSQIEACESDEDKLERKLSEVDSKIEALQLELQELNLNEGLSQMDERRMDVIEQKLDELMEQQDSLMNKLADTDMSPTERELNALFNEIGEGNATPAQKKRLKELRDRLIQESHGRITVK
ncbi:hypothetical protein [Agarilytica rhodophyticola]|uniref:hypothetical protein n=1 Tax=Agarilytica rhodophyticola TaxID=1737490 RepID=UPI000B3498B4|nr:hypothetical protein [Agarilytica rhodophyticola]